MHKRLIIDKKIKYMALSKLLQFGENWNRKYNKTYLLYDYKCHSLREHNEYRPSSNKTCDRLDLTVVAPGREDMDLYDWFVKGDTYSGRIIIELPPTSQQGIAETKEILFEGASCFALEEDYHANKQRLRVLKLSLVADEISIENVKFKRI